MTRPTTPLAQDCTAYAERLAAWVDALPDDPDPVQLMAHLDRCVRCRQLLADLREIKDVAAALEPIEPSERVWGALERQIRPDSGRRPSSWLLSPLAWAGGAAALLLAVVVQYHVVRPVMRPAPPSGGEQTESPPHPIEEAYEDAIRRLEAVQPTGGSSLKPGAAALARGLAVIDEAIVESRAALDANPRHSVARSRLRAGLRRKVSLLKSVAAFR